MKIAISGSTGLIGQAVSSHLRAAGHEVIALVRSQSQATDADHCWWQPEKGVAQPEKLAGVDAVIHLAGRSIAEHRWTESEKELLRRSRVQATELLCRDLLSLPQPPQTFLAASAVGIYGDCSDAPVTEDRQPGNDFLARLAVDWEAASASLQSAGVRRIHARLGVVLSREGGALARMLPAFRLGLGGNLGSGRQFWSWIALADAVRAIEKLVIDPACEGPFNIVAPEPVTNAEFTRQLAHAVHRMRFLPVPAFALRLGLGQMADAALLASCRAIPARLTELGFAFEYPTLESALLKLLHAAAD
ncbi:MAG: TIGR01777 family oxidoreductase [Aureliella sp.]